MCEILNDAISPFPHFCKLSVNSDFFMNQCNCKTALLIEYFIVYLNVIKKFDIMYNAGNYECLCVCCSVWLRTGFPGAIRKCDDRSGPWCNIYMCGEQSGWIQGEWGARHGQGVYSISILLNVTSLRVRYYTHYCTIVWAPSRILTTYVYIPTLVPNQFYRSRSRSFVHHRTGMLQQNAQTYNSTAPLHLFSVFSTSLYSVASTTILVHLHYCTY